MELLKKPIYPIEPWNITEIAFESANNFRNETTFALSNGYIGTRGTFEEAYDFTEDEGLEGNFINGFYESESIRYGEWNFGFPLKSQSLLNLPDLKAMQLTLGDEKFDMRTGSIENYRRTLSMKEGVVLRSLNWTSPMGKTIHLETRRFVSMDSKNLMAIEYSVTPLNFDGEITLCSVLNADVCNHTRTTNPLVDYGPFGRHMEPDELLAEADGKLPLLFYQGHTKNSGLTMACGCLHELSAESDTTVSTSLDSKTDTLCRQISFSIPSETGKAVTLRKYIVYTSDIDMSTKELKPFVLEQLRSAASLGYKELEQRHRLLIADFWKHADIVVEGDEALLQGLRFNLYHIMQAAGRDGKTGMGAKGLSGEGYEGHYFWDTEMYILPVFVYTAPELAKKLLDYRFHTLPEARERAKVLGHPLGALYPWRTINGEEASTYFPLGTAQYHINADVAYAFQLYVTVTGDIEYLKEKAAEVLCETARVWADVGSFAECKDGRYCICAVTGPDEYNAIVDNNFYTNLMARENLRDAIKALETIRETDQEAYDKLAEKIGLSEEEPVLWKKIADNMYFPYDEKRKIYPMDDGFMMRKPWDDSKIPVEKRHLLYENYHPLFIYRQKMSKQADAIFGLYLHRNYFTEEELRRNYDFYQEVTLHHSSLSTCIFGILASRIGYREEAYDYFSQSARMDLDDHHNNFYAGIHGANMAGTWQAIVNGFAGLSVNTGRLEISPYCPKEWTGYHFRTLYRDSFLEINVQPKVVQATLLNDIPVDFSLNNRDIHLNNKGDFACEAI